MRVTMICAHAKGSGHKHHISNTQKNKKNTTFSGTEQIFGFRQVDETLYRGARPNPEQISDLKRFGISTIIDFTTEPFKIADYSEANYAKAHAMKHIKIPVVMHTNPTDEQINQFFSEVEAAKKNRQKVYIHCMEGRDRTGLFVELYKIKYGLSNAQTSINTLIKSRYNFSENPLALNLLREFETAIKHI